MNENFSDNNQSVSPVLDATQQQVLRALRAKETDKYPLGDWYFGAICALQNKYNPDRIAQAAQSLRELLEKLPRVVRDSDVVGAYDFGGMRRGIYKRWIKDKKRYDGKWKDKNVDVQLDKTLRKIDQYFEQNQMPTRKEQIQSAIGQIDPMADMFDPNIQKSKWDQYNKIWTALEGFAHHGNTDEQQFRECLSDIDQIIFDLLAPITVQNQQEIRTILEKPAPTEDDINSMLELITRRGANYRFFFEYVENPVWIPILKDQGFFNTPPNVKPTDDGYVIYPFWSPLSYLKRVANNAPKLVVDILADIPETDNPRVLQEICEIACDIENIELSLKLKPWFTRYIKSPHKWIGLYDLIVKIVNRWIGGSKDSVMVALELSKIAVSFRADPLLEEKHARRLENRADRETHLETSPKSSPDFEEWEYWKTELKPSPRSDQWEYQQILENGIRPLCEKEPYQIARILIDATASMIRLSKHQEELDKEGDADSSEIWCRRLNRSVRNYADEKERLVHTLTFACEKVYEKSPESIASLDQIMKKQQWKVFKRLRQHLYALNPNEQTLPWIREFILEHKDYAKWEHHYEFQLMVRKACEYFGVSLLNEGERTKIFEAILSGPSKENHREWMGEQFTEDGFQQSKRKFHRKQLRPFARLLTGEYQNYFQVLEGDEEKPLSDEDYSPVGQVKGGRISYRSPKLPEELVGLGGEELLTYINTWQEERPWYEEDRYEDDQWIEINIRALADAFQTAFKDRGLCRIVTRG